jgi:hypothetical protein
MRFQTLGLKTLSFLCVWRIQILLLCSSKRSLAQALRRSRVENFKALWHNKLNSHGAQDIR